MDGCFTVAGESGQKVARVAYGVDDMCAVGEVYFVCGGFFAIAALDLVDEAAGFGSWETGILELLAGEFGCLALESSVVAQDPAVHEFGVAEWVSSEPFDAQLGVC
jgi:hypothetical protein